MARTFDIPELVRGTREAQDRLNKAIATLDDRAVREQSILAGWTRAHVLTHLARSAESGTRMLEAALNGRVADQYPGGAAAREAAIQAGAGRPAAELTQDVRATAKVLDDMVDLMAPEAWERPVVFLAIGEQPAARVIWSRWREVEIHHSDLDIGYTAADWPEAFVKQYLPGELRRLASRLPDGLSIEIRVDGYEGLHGPADAKPMILTGTPWALYAWLVGRMPFARAGLTAEYNGTPSDVIQLPMWA